MKRFIREFSTAYFLTRPNIAPIFLNPILSSGSQTKICILIKYRDVSLLDIPVLYVRQEYLILRCVIPVVFVQIWYNEAIEYRWTSGLAPIHATKSAKLRERGATARGKNSTSAKWKRCPKTLLRHRNKLVDAKSTQNITWHGVILRHYARNLRTLIL